MESQIKPQCDTDDVYRTAYGLMVNWMLSVLN